MKSTALRFSILAAAAALTACSGVQVTTDFDHAAHFGKYKTYALEPPKHGHTLAPVSEAALRDTIRTEFAARGITEVPAAKADLAVVRHVLSHEQITVQQYTDWGYHGVEWPYLKANMPRGPVHRLHISM